MKKILLIGFVTMASLMTFAQSGNKEFPVEEKDIETFNFLYYEFTGPYDKSFGDFTAMMGFINEKGVEIAGFALGIFYDNPEEVAPEKCRSEIGIMVKSCEGDFGPYKCKTVEGGKAVVTNYKSMEDIMGAYTAVSKYIMEKGLQTEPYSMEFYKSSDPNVVDADIVFMLKE